MPQLKHLQSALGWSLIGLLLTYVLINIIGFASPFWGLWRHPGDIHASHNLLRAWQPITPWFSVLFVVAAWHLAMTTRSMIARAAIVAAGFLVPVAHIGSRVARRAMEQAGPTTPFSLPATVDLLGSAYIGFAGLLFLFLVWRAIRMCNRALGPARQEHA